MWAGVKMKNFLFIGIFLSLNLWSQDQPDTQDHSHSHVRSLIRHFGSINRRDIACEPPLKLEGLDEESKLLAEKKWYEGSKDCELPGAKEPPYEVHQVNDSYYVMRQNKCINFEAPFLYLYIGEDTALLLDTGATHSAAEMPLRKWVDDMLKKHPKGDQMKLVVAHSHSHGDHTAGDQQFKDRPNTTVIGTSPEEVAKAFNIENWPKGEGSIDLGGRKLSIIPIPGHEASSIAVYDHVSGDLLTGDTMYPGNIFLSAHNWPQFTDSINRLHAFSQKNKVRNILGAHIEMSAEPGKDFPYGSKHHPNEHNLPLRQEHLNELKKYIDGNPKPTYKKFADFIIYM
jgi:glyoxylase-like metal-dependent hydrolase (beta-lactamase superfamily II)